MQKRRKSRSLKTPPNISMPSSLSQRVFREAIFDVKYELWVERMKLARGESDFNALRQKANVLIEVIERRHRQVFSDRRRKRVRLSAAELIALPFF
jgi:hypothetical protein